MKKESIPSRGKAAGFGIEGDDLAFPLGVEQIPVGFETGGIDELGVVAQQEQRRADVDQNIAPFGIDELLFALPPLRLIFDLGQDIRRGDRIEDFALIESVRRSVAEVANVGEKFSRSAARP